MNLTKFSYDYSRHGLYGEKKKIFLFLERGNSNNVIKL